MFAVRTISLTGCGLDAQELLAIAEALKLNVFVTSLNLLGNNIGMNAVAELAAVLQQHKTLKSLCGLKPDQTEADFSSKSLQPSDGMLLAADLKVNAVLTSLNLRNNRIGDAGGAALAEALKVNAALTSLNLADSAVCAGCPVCGIPVCAGCRADLCAQGRPYKGLPL